MTDKLFRCGDRDTEGHLIPNTRCRKSDCSICNWYDEYLEDFKKQLSFTKQVLEHYFGFADNEKKPATSD